MKNTIAGILAIILFLIIPGVAGYTDTHYTMTCKVIEIRGERVTVEDKTKNVWEFFGDGFAKGDEIKVTFYNNTTDSTRMDDEIVKTEILK